MTTGIKLSGTAYLDAINSRTQKAPGSAEDEPKIPANDYQLHFTNVPFASITHLLGSQDRAAMTRLHEALFEQSGSGMPRFPALMGDWIRIDVHAMDKHHVILFGETVYASKIVPKRFKLTAGQMVTLHVGVSFLELDPRIKELLQEQWHDEIDTEIEPTDDFDYDAWVAGATAADPGRDPRTPDMFEVGQPTDDDPGKPTAEEQTEFGKKIQQAMAQTDSEVSGRGIEDPLFADAYEMVAAGKLDLNTKSITSAFKIGVERATALLHALTGNGAAPGGGNDLPPSMQPPASRKKSASKKKAAAKDDGGALSPNLH